MKKRASARKKRPAPKRGKDQEQKFTKGVTKDGPFPMWARVASESSFGKDAPFPMRVGLYWERIPFETVYQGNRGPEVAVAKVVRSAAELASAFPGFTASGVNFDTEQIILVGLGLRNDNATMAQIDDVFYFTDRGSGRQPLTSVNFGEYKTNGQSDVQTHPVHVVKTRKLKGDEVQFSDTPRK